MVKTRHKVRTTRGGRDSRAPLGSRPLLHLHFPDVVPLQALDHLLHLVLHAGLMCLSHLCSPSRSLFKSVERTGPWGRVRNLRASPEICGFTLLTLRSPPFKHGPRRGLHHFRFTSVISRRKKKSTSCLCKPHTGFPQGKRGYLSVSVALFFLMSHKYNTNGIIELIRPFKKNSLSVCDCFSGADFSQ